MVLAGVFAACGVFAFQRLIRERGARAIAAPLTLYSTQFLWFVLPTLLELNAAYKIPQTRYSSGILAVLHSAQYLWITSYFQKREFAAAGKSNWRLAKYFVTLIAGGIALFIPGPWLVSYVFRFDFTTSFLIFTSLVNIHHFLLDGAIWKLRDSKVSSLLTGQNAQPQQTTAVAKCWRCDGDGRGGGPSREIEQAENPGPERAVDSAETLLGKTGVSRDVGCAAAGLGRNGSAALRSGNGRAEIFPRCGARCG